VEHIRKLEIHRLIKELDFVKSDYDYKSELLVGADTEFIQDVHLFLNNHPELKVLFEEKTKVSEVSIPTNNDPIVDSLVETTEPISYKPNVEDYEIVTIPKDPKLKTLYRNIVKSTHPDKVNDFYLKELYMEATKAYDNDSLLPILTICDKLGIPYDISEEETNLIRDEISTLRTKSQFLESTYTWKWCQHTDDNIREMVILSYVKKQIL
jgi:hypothetical protein